MGDEMHMKAMDVGCGALHEALNQPKASGQNCEPAQHTDPSEAPTAKSARQLLDELIIATAQLVNLLEKLDGTIK